MKIGENFIVHFKIGELLSVEKLTRKFKNFVFIKEASGSRQTTARIFVINNSIVVPASF